jgi:hypothetical protein
MPNALLPLEWHPHPLVKSACASSAPGDVRLLIDALAIPGQAALRHGEAREEVEQGAPPPAELRELARMAMTASTALGVSAPKPGQPSPHTMGGVR